MNDRSIAPSLDGEEADHTGEPKFGDIEKTFTIAVAAILCATAVMLYFA